MLNIQWVFSHVRVNTTIVRLGIQSYENVGGHFLNCRLLFQLPFGGNCSNASRIRWLNRKRLWRDTKKGLKKYPSQLQTSQTDREEMYSFRRDLVRRKLHGSSWEYCLGEVLFSPGFKEFRVWLAVLRNKNKRVCWTRRNMMNLAGTRNSSNTSPHDRSIA